MVAEYTRASKSGRWCSFSDCFRKKLTVIGIIGKTHGVTSETSPHAAAVNRKAPRPVVCGATEWLPTCASRAGGALVESPVGAVLGGSVCGVGAAAAGVG